MPEIRPELESQKRESKGRENRELDKAGVNGSE